MSIKKTATYGAGGIIIGALIIAGLIVSGLLPMGLQSQGTLIVKLTDAPVELKHLNVTITGLAVQKAGEGNGGGGWVTLPFLEGKTSVYVDILALQNVTKDLSATGLNAGNYTKIRIDISTANATYADGSTVNLIVPPGHLDVVVHFEIVGGETTTLLVDMTGRISESEPYRLSPVLKATVV